MLNLKKHCIGGLLAVSIGAMSLAAYAADATMNSPAHSGAPTPEMMAKFAKKMEKRQEALHAKLKLTPEQEPAWKIYVGQIKLPGDGSLKRPDHAAMAKLTTPERMEKFLAGMQAREKFVAARLDAVKTFYAVLTPEQQKTFDAAYAHRRFGHGRRHWDHHEPAAGAAATK